MKIGKFWLRRDTAEADAYDLGGDALRRTKVLSALLIAMIIICLLFAAVNGILFPLESVMLINIVCAMLALLALILLRATGNYRMAAYMTMIMIMAGMIVYFHYVQNQHYAFIWVTIIPPIAFYLLNYQTASVLMVLFNGYVIYYFIAFHDQWKPTDFGMQSILSIVSATVCITGMLANFVKNRNDVMKELKEVGIQLENKQNDLRLILDSAAEAIYGIDLEGNCTFCNRRCIELLGYQQASDLLGRNMHGLIHHSMPDGSPIAMDDCNIFSALYQGERTHIEDEVFWRADHTSFAVEYYSYPQIKNSKVVGAVITFTDITERKRKESEIAYLNCYDILTGLHNRRCFEENRERIDRPDNLPIAVIFADINGLKMTNDIFGHAAGDELIKKSADILRKACRQQDLIARVGGDEFIIILPKTAQEHAQQIAARIRAGFADAKVEAIKCSIALGIDTKSAADQPLDETLANAENAMYRDKTMNRMANNQDIIDTIVETLHARNEKEKAHAEAVSELCQEIGVAMHLPQTDIVKLQRAGYLHDIGKIVLDEAVLAKNQLTDEEMEGMRQHSAIGYRILSLFDDTLDLAEYIYGHHEKWDGTGYPRGLRGEQIPLLSRIIAVAESYDRIRNRVSGQPPAEGQARCALDILRDRAGTQLDPGIVKLFVCMMENKEKGEP